MKQDSLGIRLLWNLQKQSFADVFPKGVLKNFTIFTEKHLCWSLLLIKLPYNKIPVKKIISQESFSQKFLRSYLARSVCKNNSFTVFFTVFVFFKHVRDVSRTQSNIKMEPFAKIVNSSRDVFTTGLKI